MKRVPRRIFTEEFKKEAVRLFKQQDLTLAEVSRNLDIAPKSLKTWVALYEAGTLKASIGVAKLTSEQGLIVWTGKSSELCCNFAVNGILNGEIGRALIVYFCVASHAVIKDFDLFTNDTLGLLSGVETIMRQTFSYKRAKETFHRRIMRVCTACKCLRTANSQPLPLRLIDVCIP